MGAAVALFVLLLIVAGAFAISPVVGFIAIAVLVFAFFKLAKVEIETVQEPKEPEAQSFKSELKKPADTHVAAKPQANLIEPWSGRLQHYEVAGEFYRSASIQKLFTGASVRKEGGAELRLPAVLVPDPGNPFDRNAVAVYVNDHHVGYLEREDAKDFAPALAALAQQGQSLQVESRQWARYDNYRRDLYSRVTLRLPDPDAITPRNAVPSDSVVLPAGSTIQVTKEDEHMDAITPWLDAKGGEVTLAVTLHAIVDIRPRSAVDAVQVQIDGRPVGILSPTSTANVLPLVKYVAERGMAPVARATLKGNALKADVTLHVSKAQDVDPAWIMTLGPVTQPIPSPEPASQRPEFEWDDDPEATPLP